MYSTALIDPKQATAEKETLKHHANSLLVAKLKQESPDNDTPELRLIRLTMEHPGFSLAYSFPSLDEYFPSEDYSYPSLEYDWFISDVGMKTSKVMNSLDMIAVDCEMVLCEDGREGLVRVGAVDRNLKRVLQPFLSNGSILVGHSLNKDMRVLKIDHPKVIDTALVFNFSHARESRKPSLNDLYKAIFGGEVRVEGASHNCVHDAAAAMKIALAFIKKPFDTTITRSEEILEAEKSKLFIHRIRSYVPSEELNLLLAEKFGSGKFKLDVKPAKTGRRHYCAVVVFDSSQEADQAFANVGGNEKTDSYGYPQKLIDLSRISLIGVTCFVRKMV